MKEKVLITGGKGFIGKYVTELLENKYHVCHLDGNVFNISFDEYMKKLKPHYLINLAWITGPGYLESHDNVKFVYKGIEMYDAFYKNGGKRAVFVGTEQEYQRKSEPLSETDIINPVSLYAECKADLGKILVKNSKLEGTGFVWARLFFIYGAGEKSKRLMPSVISSLLNNKDVICSYSEYVRDYINVYDVATAILCCLFSDYTGCVNVGGGRRTTIGEIAGIIKDYVGGNGTIHFKDHEECNQDMCIEADNSLLKSLGWVQKYSMKDGLIEEIEKFKNMP